MRPYSKCVGPLLAAALLLSVTVRAHAGLSDSAAIRQTVVVIPIAGNVDPGMAAFLGRAVHEAQKYPRPIIVLEMDTFGGRVDAALQMVDTMVNARDATTIAYVKDKAISAGALIALSCGMLVMKHNTTIGDCAPIAMSNDGTQMLGEKFQSPLRATFRSLAKRNHYPQTLAESMVTAGMIVYKVRLPDTVLYLDSLQWADFPKEKKSLVAERKTVVGAGQLLTMDDAEAHDLGFSRMSVSSLDEALAGLHITNYETVRVGQSWSEGFVRIIESLAPILMLIGFGALYLEFKSPGVAIFAVIGVLCLGLVFFGQYLAGMANYTELLLIVVGVVLVGIEIFVTPGMFMLGIAGLLCIAIGILLSLQGFVIPNPSMPWQGNLFAKNAIEIMASLVLALGLSVSLVRFVFPRLGIMTHGPYLMDSLKDVHAESEDAKSARKGDVGTAVTLLRPAGKALIGGVQHDVVTLGDFIEKGSEIVVVDISQNRIVVSRKSS